jgi:hypothetical protein
MSRSSCVASCWATASATIRFALAARGRAWLALHDALGREVARFADGTWEAGEHEVHVALRGAANDPLAPGLHFLRLDAEGSRSSRRLAVVR